MVELVSSVRRETAANAGVAARALRAAKLIQASTGRRWVGVYRVHDGHVTNLAWSGPAPPEHPVFSVRAGLTGAAIESERTVIANNVATDPRYLTNQASTGSELIVPIIIGGRVVGTLDIEAAETEAFDDRDRLLFEMVAAALAGLYI